MVVSAATEGAEWTDIDRPGSSTKVDRMFVANDTQDICPSCVDPNLFGNGRNECSFSSFVLLYVVGDVYLP